MKKIQDDADLSSSLHRVGLKVGEHVDIGSGSVAETWASDYAEVYLVDAATLNADSMPELLSRLDKVVAKRLRQQRDEGRFIDAHVCILVTQDLIGDARVTRESDASRYVSRKYWIDRNSPVEEILRRLTLTWVEVDATSPGVGSQHLQEFSELRRRIANRMGTSAASDFLEALKK